MNINKPTQSKLNATGLVISTIGVIAGFDLIPPKVEEHLVEISMMITGPLVIVLRSFFTGNKS